MEPDEYPFLRWLNADEFPVGAFAIFCAILGGASNFWTGTFLLNLLGRSESGALFVWVLLGIGGGIGIALKFICWLGDRN